MTIDINTNTIDVIHYMCGFRKTRCKIIHKGKDITNTPSYYNKRFTISKIKACNTKVNNDEFHYSNSPINVLLNLNSSCPIARLYVEIE